MQSGDAGYFNDNKQLVVIDRIKDLAETSRGERFSPQYIENKLKFSPYIAETVVLGAGRDALAAMICIRYLDHLEMGGEEPHLVHDLYRPRLAARKSMRCCARRSKRSTPRCRRRSASPNSCCSTRSSTPTTAN